MLSTKTLLVIGAGASAEVGLPIGTKLKNEIAKKLGFRGDPFGRHDPKYGDEVIYNALRQYRGKTFNQYIQSCISISEGIELSSSIDNFIDAHKHDILITECGKLAIARSILEAEKGSKLFINPSNALSKMNFSAITETWYTKFYEWLTNGVNKENLDSVFENLTVISFNYDRCLQHFLTHAIAKNFLISTEQSKEIVRKLRIHFPYGSVGALLSPNPPNVSFGSEYLPEMDSVLAGLKTYTEQIENNETLTAIRSAVAESETMIFLGNNYHDTNINLLCGEYKISNISKVLFGTRKGIESDSDLEVVKNKLERLNNRPNLFSFFFSDTCSDLFREYGRSMRGS